MIHNLGRDKKELSHFYFQLPHKSIANFYIVVLFHLSFLLKIVLLKLHELMVVVMKVE